MRQLAPETTGYNRRQPDSPPHGQAKSGPPPPLPQFSPPCSNPVRVVDLEAGTPRSAPPPGKASSVDLLAHLVEGRVSRPLNGRDTSHSSSGQPRRASPLGEPYAA